MKAIKMDKDSLRMKCMHCRKNYDMKVESQKAELMGSRDILCPACGGKVGKAQY